MNWKYLELDADSVKRFAERFRIDPLLAEVFLRRGILEPEDVRAYLDLNLRSTHCPFQFVDMENVIERIDQAAQDGEKVLVFGDRDVDGITSTALMVRKLKGLGIEALWRLPKDDDAYGLHPGVIEDCLQQGVSLIISVDCGITNVAEIAAARELGIDVIVIDHHNPQEEPPAAIGIVNPKVADCGYPFAGLSAAALVAKVNWAIEFAKTPFYNQEVCLLNVRPGNDAIVFEAVKLKNLVESGRLRETIVAGNQSVLLQRIVPFIQDSPIYVYNATEQKRYLGDLFGRADIYLTDLSTDVATMFPDLRGKSLLRMLPSSRLARFSNQAPGEIDVLVQMYKAIINQKIQTVWEAHETDLSLVALSLIADMMPMQNENRSLVHNGLESFHKLKAGGLHALLLELRLIQPPISLKDIGWRLSPVLNSAGRLGRPELALQLLLSEDPSKSLKLVRELLALNEERKSHGDAAWKRLQKEAHESRDRLNGTLILVRDDGIPRGITGILAGKFSKEFSLPALIVAKTERGLIGSIRTCRGVVATDFLGSFGDILSDWGGHDAAGGFFMHENRYEEFLVRAEQKSRMIELSDQSAEEPLIDLWLSHDRMNETLWQVEQCFLPSGQESPPILYACSHVVIKSISLVGKEKKHVKLNLEVGSRVWPAVFWDAADRVREEMAEGSRVDIMFRLEMNTWNANSSLQLQILDLRSSSAPR